MKNLSEQDICTKFITPAIEKSGWDKMTQLREQVSFTSGRILVRGKTIERGEGKRADYILYYEPNFPIAVIEAKDNKQSIGSGMQQAIAYAEVLDVPFAYSSNGDGFLEHDFLTGKERQIRIDELPSPEELYQRYKLANNIEAKTEDIIRTPYYSDSSGKTPRYYQEVAINRSVKAVAEGQKRILLVMATGTGKTFVAGQIIWRLWKSGQAKRILFLADRNILVDQTMVNDFKHFGDKMTKVKHRQIDKAYEIYLALYQGITGNEEESNAYKQFSPDFFDLIVVDECHRGSTAEDSPWRDVLNYFQSATHIGLTATPKETKDASNIEYFGEPIYTYSLKQGIEDGFLAPYKVIQIMLDKDLGGYRPTISDRDTEGREIEDKIYTDKDFDRNLVLVERTKTVAKEITKYLKETDRFGKTIVFCVDIDHAERMRQALVNENADLIKENSKYVMRITGDNDEGKKELDNFIDPENLYPTIVTTSKLLTTGVDAQTCKNIVLDSNIRSMTEFKQIIGRGTRIREDYGKTHFTILDFRKVTELFADPDFDGPPEQIKEIKPGDDSVSYADEIETGTDLVKDEGMKYGEEMKPIIVEAGEIEKEKSEKIYVDGVPVEVIYRRTQYQDAHGKLITESFKDYTKKQILKEYASLDDFVQKWSKSNQKFCIIEELEKQGVMIDELQKTIGQELDPFDLILHVAFGKQKLMTRKERAEKVRKSNYFTKYKGQAREVINALLDKYADQGIAAIDDIGDLTIMPFSQFGTPIQIVNDIFGGKEKYLSVINKIQREIYA
jgi:type I restriction enzyme R subunit